MQPMTRAQFLGAIAEAKHGERIVYHVGYLYGDRQLGTTWETMHSGIISQTANAAMQAAEDGHVRLFQRKLQVGIYEYIAERCLPPKPIKWEGCYDPNSGKYVKPRTDRMARKVERKRPDTRQPHRPVFQDAA